MLKHIQEDKSSNWGLTIKRKLQALGLVASFVLFDVKLFRAKRSKNKKCRRWDLNPHDIAATGT
jgi:hypothetical protein